MHKEEELFNAIMGSLIKSNRLVKQCRMMSAPAITYKKKVFCFYYKQEMGFRAGRDFNPATLKIKDWKYLNPYKSKPPMLDWFLLPYSEADKWPAVAAIALDVLKKGGRL